MTANADLAAPNNDWAYVHASEHTHTHTMQVCIVATKNEMITSSTFPYRKKGPCTKCHNSHISFTAGVHENESIVSISPSVLWRCPILPTTNPNSSSILDVVYSVHEWRYGNEYASRKRSTDENLLLSQHMHSTCSHCQSLANRELTWFWRWNSCIPDPFTLMCCLMRVTQESVETTNHTAYR